MFRREVPSCLQAKIVTPAQFGPTGKNILDVWRNRYRVCP